MSHEAFKYLFDIRTSIESIDEYLGTEPSFEVYEGDKMLRRAVERELEIIGEAVGKILIVAPNIYIDNARRIVGLRNRVIHGYDSVDNETVWGVITHHLPMLKKEIDTLLK